MRKALPLLLCCAASIIAIADTPRSYQEFKKGMLERYQKFRSEILENYDKFLAGEWKPITVENKESIYAKPKPVTQPVMEAGKPDAPAIDITPLIPDEVKDTPQVSPKGSNHVTPEFVKFVVDNNPAIKKDPMYGLAPRMTINPNVTIDDGTIPGNLALGGATPTTPDVSKLNVPEGGMNVNVKVGSANLNPKPGVKVDPTVSVDGTTAPGNVTLGSTTPSTPDVSKLNVPEGSMNANVKVGGANLNPKPGMKVDPRVSVDGNILPGNLSIQPDLTLFGDNVPNMCVFDFYGIEMTVPDMDYSIMARCSDNKDFAQQWRNLNEENVAAEILPYLDKLASDCNLNDYLTMRLIMKYVKGRFPDVDQSSRQSLCHYLLAHMGYDVRLSRVEESGLTLLLVPLAERVYNVAVSTSDDGKIYTVFDESDNPYSFRGGVITSCTIPKDIDAGRSLELRITDGLNLPYKPVKYNIKYGDMTLSGEVNGNIFPMIYRYPQMYMSGFAMSTLLPDVREDLIKQVKEQLKGMNQKAAVDKLLRFIQKGFEYETDENLHGFEKPYFVEEILFYPKCDCEDRAILYTWLLWNALGVENHLLFFSGHDYLPGHECAAVKLDEEINGEGYNYEGNQFYYSDPTYLGSRTGELPKKYQPYKPTIDLQYKK